MTALCTPDSITDVDFSCNRFKKTKLNFKIKDIMTINLSPSEMYGHWTHCEPKVCEFQYGRIMIYVSYGEDKSMASRLTVAQATVDEAFLDIENALDFAKKISEKRNEVFWQNANRISLRQNPLLVFAVHYSMDSDFPVYEISWNPNFKPEVGEALSEDYIEQQISVERLPDNDDVIYVRRLGANQYIQAPKQAL